MPLFAVQVVRHWRAWAPAKRAKRRKLRDVQAALSSSERVRIWGALREYTAKRRASGKRKRQAQQHFRWELDTACTHACLSLLPWQCLLLLCAASWATQVLRLLAAKCKYAAKLGGHCTPESLLVSLIRAGSPACTST